MKKGEPSKKTTFSAAEYLQQSPAPSDIMEKDGGFHIPILSLENALDVFEWSEQNFRWEMYKDRFANLGVAASVELVLKYKEGTRWVTRTFVGACNFLLQNLHPIPDFLATAKSLCIKNAASDAGRKLGRGLNEEVMPAKTVEAMQEKKGGKMKPDEKILAQFKAAQEKGDTTHMGILSNIYELNNENNGNETL